MFLSSLSREAIGESSGVGIVIAQQQSKCIPYLYKSTLLQRLQEQGRTSSYYLEVAGGHTILVHIAYLWMVSVHENTANGSFNDLLEALLTVSSEISRCPQIIIGDPNAEPINIQALHARAKAKQWIDIGSPAAKWGGIQNQTTCKAQKDGNSYRRDIALANSDASTLLHHFQVCLDSDLLNARQAPTIHWFRQQLSAAIPCSHSNQLPEDLQSQCRERLAEQTPKRKGQRHI